MTLLQPLLKSLKAPSVLLVAFLFAAACASAPARPPVQIGSGDPRAEPVATGKGPAVITDDDVAGVDPEDTDTNARSDGGLIPPFMEGREIQRAAVLLPFSHPSAQVRAEAESMLAGIELALFEYADKNFLILPLDTGGKASIAEARADEALAEGADIILGPLFGANVAAVRTAANRKSVPVIAFSNDRNAAGGGAYLASVSPEEEVTRVMQYAGTRGVKTFFYLGPDSNYGRQVEAAMRFQAGRQGGVVAQSAFYDPSGGAVAEARQIASAVQSASGRAPGQVAVMIPERGVKLLSVAPLLPYNGVDLRRIKLLGTSLWDDPSVWREPTLQGGLYASPDPENRINFNESYQRIYGRKPTDLGAVAYDAAALAVRLAAEDNIAYNGVTDPDGFMGVNGLFRFRLDGTSERGLAVMEVRTTGAAAVEAGVKEFTAGGS